MNLFKVTVFLFLFAGEGYSQWEVKNVDLSVFNTLNVIKFYDEDYGMAMGSNGLIYTSEDQGESWQHLEGNLREDIIDFVFLNSDTIFCITTIYNAQRPENKIYKSTDKAMTWNGVYSGQDEFYSIEIFSNMHIVVSGSDRIYKSSDFGENWDVVLDLVEAEYKFGTIEHLDVVNDSLTFAVGHAFDENIGDIHGIIYKSTDHGTSWSKILSSEDWFRHVYFYNDSIGFVSSNETTYKTTDGGNSFEALETLYDLVGMAVPSMNNIKTIHRPVAYIPEAPNTQFAITESKDGGLSWEGEYRDGAHLESIFFLNDSTGFVAGDYSIIMKTQTGGGEIIGNYPWHLFITSTQKISTHDLKIFPNPASDYLYLELDDISNWSYTILSNMGEKVQSNKLSSNRIDIANLPHGQYTIVLMSGSEYKVEKVIIK